MSLADKGEDSKEHCHQGEWLEERCRHADQRGQAQASPNPSHVQTDTGCIGGLHKPEGQFVNLILIPVSAMSTCRLGTAGNTGSHLTANPPAPPPPSPNDPKSLLI